MRDKLLSDIRAAINTLIAFPLPLVATLTFAAEGETLRKSDFEAVMAQPVVAQVDDAELRSFVVSLSKERDIPLVFDRRIDASRPIAWKFEGEPFLHAIGKGLDEAGAAPRTVGSTLYLGPTASASRLRTLIALRQDELKRLSRWPANRRIGAQGRHRIDWADAESPRELLKKIARRWGLPVPGSAWIPNDLWAEGSMGGVDAAEALSLILIQFDCTFRWTEASPGVEIVPIPEKVVIDRRHKVPRGRADGLLEQLAILVPAAGHSLEGDELLLSGTLEDHEAVDVLLSPQGAHHPRKSAPDVPIPLAERRFTVTAEQVTVRDAIKAVEAYGIEIEFDEDALAEAKINLDRRVDLKLQMATIDQLLRAVCHPAGLRYEIDGLTVTLSPRPARGESRPSK